MDVVLYDIPAWGVGELYFRTGKLLYHELPRAGATPDEQAEHPLAERIRAHGLLVPGIRPPTVPDGESLLRVSVSLAHQEEHGERLLEALMHCQQ